jgi:hypothetical protein
MKPPRRNTRRSNSRHGEPRRPRRLFVEQLEQRELLAGLQSVDDFGPPPTDRMAQDYWEAYNIVKNGSSVPGPLPVVPGGPDNPGYTVDFQRYDPQLGLRTQLEVTGITADYMNFLSRDGVTIISVLTPAGIIGGTYDNPASWSQIDCWIPVNDVDDILTSHPAFIGFPEVGAVNGGLSADGNAPALLGTQLEQGNSPAMDNPGDSSSPPDDAEALSTINPTVIDLGGPTAVRDGNVTAEVVDGTLVVRGDDAGNQVLIEAIGNDSFALQGINGWTTINGQVAWPSGLSGDHFVTISGVTGGLDIDLGDGDNVVRLYGALPSVKIATGSGKDSIALADYCPLGTVILDSFYIPGPANIQGGLVVDTGAGDDDISPYVNVSGDVSLQMGGGNDRVNEGVHETLDGPKGIEGLKASGTVLIDLGPDQLAPIDSDARAALDYARTLRESGGLSADITTIDYVGGLYAPISISPTGAVLMNAEFTPGRTSVVEELTARGFTLGRSFPDVGHAEVWVDESNVDLLAGIVDLWWITLPERLVTGDPIYSQPVATNPIVDEPPISGDPPPIAESPAPVVLPVSPGPLLPQPDAPGSGQGPGGSGNVGSAASDAAVSNTIGLTTPDGSPLTSIVPGQEFVLHAYTEDLLTDPHGVAAAYLNVHWDSSLAIAENGLEPNEWTWHSQPNGTPSRVQSGIRHAPMYGIAKSGDTSVPGLIADAGGCAIWSGVVPGTYEVFSILMKATGSGNLVFTTSPADQTTPAYYTLLYDPGYVADAVPLSKTYFGTASVEIAPAEATSSPPPASARPAQPVATALADPASGQSRADPGDIAGPANDDQNIQATIKLATTDLKGEPITSVNVGQEFEVRAYLVLVAPAGVQPVSGFADVTYSLPLIAPANNSGDVGLVGSTVANGLIDEAGRTMYGDASGLMFTKTFTATAKGTATFAANAAELFGHEIYVSGLIDALPWSQVTFGSTTLTIKP